MDDANRLEKVNEFVGRIEKTKSSTEQKDFQITLINQKQLEKNSTVEGKYENGSWGAKYLRSSKISDKIISVASKNLLPLHKIADVKYGIKTGANDFFYLQNDTEKSYQMDNEEYLMTFGVAKEKHKSIWQKCGWYYSEMNKRHYIIERFYIEPVLKSQREAITKTP